MRRAIPEYNKHIAPLHKAMEDIYQMADGKRTRKAVSKIILQSTVWTKDLQYSFEDLKHAIYGAVELAHPDPEMQLCLFTDASDLHWSGVLAQIPRSDKDVPFDEQRHSPLSFRAGSFTGSSCRWSTAEKEAFAIVESVS